MLDTLYTEYEKSQSDFNAFLFTYRHKFKELLKEKEKLTLLEEVRKEGLRELDLEEGSQEVLKKILSVVSAYGVDALQSLIEEGLNLVFFDRMYKVRLEVLDLRGLKAMRLYLTEKIDGAEIVSDIRDAVGGAIKTVVSLLCRVFLIYNDKKAKRVLFMDETFADIAVEYKEGLFRLLNELHKKWQFSFVLITHDAGVLEYADRVYVVRNGKTVLQKGSGVKAESLSDIEEAAGG